MQRPTRDEFAKAVDFIEELGIKERDKLDRLYESVDYDAAALYQKIVLHPNKQELGLKTTRDVDKFMNAFAIVNNNRDMLLGDLKNMNPIEFWRLSMDFYPETGTAKWQESLRRRGNIKRLPRKGKKPLTRMTKEEEEYWDPGFPE
jgi:hypothetical protein